MISDELDLKDTSSATLRARISVREFEGAHLISIDSEDKNLERALAVANLLPTIAQRRYRELQMTENEAASKTALEELQDQTVQAEKARQRKLDFAKRYHTVDQAAQHFRASFADGPTNGFANILTTSMLSDYREAATTELTKQIDALANLNGSELIKRAAMLEIDASSMYTLLPIYQRNQLELSVLMDSGLGRNHPRVRASTNQLNQCSLLLERVLVDLQAIWQSKLKIAEIVHSKLDFDESHDIAKYTEASKAYGREKTKLANMQAKYSINQVALSYPKHSILLHQAATPATGSQADGRPVMASNGHSRWGGAWSVARGGRRRSGLRKAAKPPLMGDQESPSSLELGWS